ncbi:MAG: hypothetical protein HUJ68_12040 [Clostridia bacterium]|nr:hypothetical protein [Clostridia bacterium]
MIGFDEFIKDIIHIRNLITHNYVMFKADIKYQSEALKKLYFDITAKYPQIITVTEIIEMIQYFTKSNTLAKNTVKAFKTMKINEKFKQKIVPFVKLRDSFSRKKKKEVKEVKNENIKFEVTL